MAQRKAFPLRLDPAVYDALQRWADAELRSVNGQIEFLLRKALLDTGRLQGQGSKEAADASDEKRGER
jgi:hypothetical protein